MHARKAPESWTRKLVFELEFILTTDKNFSDYLDAHLSSTISSTVTVMILSITNDGSSYENKTPNQILSFNSSEIQF